MQQHMENWIPHGGRGGEMMSYCSTIENMYYSKYMEKRQLFLRSYQFSKKRSFLQKVKLSLIRAKRVVVLKMRVAVKLKRWVWLRLRLRYPHRPRFHFHPLMTAVNNSTSASAAATAHYSTAY